MFSLSRVPFWVPIFDPQPGGFKEEKPREAQHYFRYPSTQALGCVTLEGPFRGIATRTTKPGSIWRWFTPYLNGCGSKARICSEHPNPY